MFQPGDRVLVWRESTVNHRIGEYLDPFNLTHIDKTKTPMFVQDSKIGAAMPFNMVQVKKYLTPEVIAHYLGRGAGEKLQKSGSYMGSEKDMYFTELIAADDPKALSLAMCKVKKAEIRNPLGRGTFKVISKEGLPLNGNVLTERFVLAVKSTSNL